MYGHMWDGIGPGGGLQPDKPPKLEPIGPTYALLSGSVVIGSTPEVVKDLILRSKGKVKGGTLAQLRAFQDAAVFRQEPGLFCLRGHPGRRGEAGCSARRKILAQE